MSLRFVLGRAGTGKSRLIADRIVDALQSDPLGPPLYLLVPAQATLLHERHYALNVLPDAGFTGYSRLRIVDFETLGNDLLAECGGAATTQITGLGRRLLLGHLLRTHQDHLAFFRGSARQPGLVQQLDRTFAELERAGLDPADLLTEVDDADDQMQAKSRDLALLGDNYRKHLADREDATMRFRKITESVKHCRSMAKSIFFVDAFDHFSAAERRLLIALAGHASEVTIALTLDPGDDGHGESHLFDEPREAYRRLTDAARSDGVSIDKPTHLTDPRRFTSPAVRLLEKDFTQPRLSKGIEQDTSSVRLVETSDPRAEVDAAARQVLDWLDAGLRLRDCLVLCRDLDAYQPLLEASFGEHGIAYFIDRRRPAKHHPLVRFLRSLLRVSQSGWQHDAVMQLIKAKLAGLEPGEADLLENYALEHRKRGRTAWTQVRPWAGQAPKPLEDEDQPAAIDEDAAKADELRRRLADVIEPMTESLRADGTLADKISALWKAMDGFGTSEAMARLIEEAEHAGDLQAASEHRQAWEALVEMLNEACELLGDETMTNADFVSVIDYGLDLMDFAVVPQSTDTLVLGDARRTRAIGCRACVVLGMSEGIFPKAAVEDTIFNAGDRQLLRARQIDVQPAARQAQFRERFLGYRAMTRASDFLTLPRPTPLDGQPGIAPSSFWVRVQTLLGSTVETVAPGDLACVATPRQMVSRLLQWTRDGSNPDDDAAALYPMLLAADGDVAVVRDRAWPALVETNDPSLSRETIKARFGKTLPTSVSRLETFVACPFKHYAGHLLELRGRDDDDATPLDQGNAFHSILQHAIDRAIQRKLDLTGDDDGAIAELRELVPELAESVAGTIRGGLLTSSAKHQHLLRRIERAADHVLRGQRGALRLGQFKPALTELGFGYEGDDSLPALELDTPGGRKVILRGKIDRLDLAAGGRFATVIDYKLGERQLRLGEVYHGLMLQLMLYLLVVGRGGGPLKERPMPVAAFYVPLRRSVSREKDPDAAPPAESELFDLRKPPRGVVSHNSMPLLDASFAGESQHATHASDAYHLKTSKDGSLDKRYDGVSEAMFQALMDHAEAKVGEVGDVILNGTIDVHPYRIGTSSPCSTCSFRSVCRFDPRRDDYNVLEPLKSSQVIERLVGSEEEEDA